MIVWIIMGNQWVFIVPDHKGPRRSFLGGVLRGIFWGVPLGLHEINFPCFPTRYQAFHGGKTLSQRAQVGPFKSVNSGSWNRLGKKTNKKTCLFQKVCLTENDITEQFSGSIWWFAVGCNCRLELPESNRSTPHAIWCMSCLEDLARHLWILLPGLNVSVINPRGERRHVQQMENPLGERRSSPLQHEIRTLSNCRANKTWNRMKRVESTLEKYCFTCVSIIHLICVFPLKKHPTKNNTTKKKHTTFNSVSTPPKKPFNSEDMGELPVLTQRVRSWAITVPNLKR